MFSADTKLETVIKSIKKYINLILYSNKCFAISDYQDSIAKCWNLCNMLSRGGTALLFILNVPISDFDAMLYENKL